MNRLLTLFFSVWLAIAGLWPTCALAGASRWAELSHTAFQRQLAGLPHPVVTTLAEDGDGFLWLGTQAGLARWDGYHFRLYHASDLPDPWVQVLHTDRQGRLWAGTRGGALARFAREQDGFIAQPGRSNRQALWAMADADLGQLWLGGDGGLDLFDSKSGRFVHWPLASTGPAPPVRALLRDRVGELWIGTERGLLRRAAHAGAAIVQTIRLPLANNAIPAITSLFQAQDGNIWIGTKQHGAWLLEPRTGQISPLQKNIALGIDTIYAIAQANTDEIWLGSFSQGIIAVNTLTLEAHRIMHQPGHSDSLPHNNVWSMLRDRAGLLWVGTGAGLARQNRANSAVFNLRSLPDSASGGQNDGVSAILADFSGQIWLGHENGGLSVIDERAQRMQPVRPAATSPEPALPRAPVEALLQQANGDILAATRRGLYQIRGEQISALTWPQHNPRAAVAALHGHDQQLWLGLWDGVRLRQRPGDSSLIKPEENQRLSDLRITAIESADDDALWIGTGNGLNWYQPKTKRVLALFATPGEPHGLASGNITSLLRDRYHRLWIGTLGGGVHVLESEPGRLPARFLQIGHSQHTPNAQPPQSLPCANVQKLLQDPYGNIWASCDRHIVRIDGKTLQLRHLTPEDGLDPGNYLPGSGTSTRQGELLFGHSNGVTVIHSHAFREWQYRPPVMITQITMQGKPVPSSRYNQPLLPHLLPHLPQSSQPSASEPHSSQSTQGVASPTLRILPQTTQFSVEFAALDYSNPEQNRYAWRLAGYDQDWINSDAEHRQATYTNLPPGHYQLLLRGSNRSGLWSDTMLPIEVLPAWYQSGWFRTLLLLLGIGTVLAVTQIRTAILRNSQRKLAAQVAERTAQWRESNRDLSQANAELTLSADILRELSEVGREITANLDPAAAFDSLQQHVQTMLKTPALVIYRISASGTELQPRFVRQPAPWLALTAVALDDPASKVAEAARSRSEVLLEQQPEASDSALAAGNMLTSLYVPLTIDDHLLGVMAVHAARAHAFGQRERLIFRTLCAYSAIALDNGQTHTQLKQAQEKLVAQEKLAALGGLVAGVAHELNTPLGNSILMTSAWQDQLRSLKTQFASGQLQAQDLADYMQDADDAGQIIMRGLQTAANLVVSFKQVAVDRTSAHQRRFNLLQTSRELIATHKIPPPFQIELAIPADIELDSYPGPYGQVLEHLISNALLHGLEGCEQGTISITAQQIEHGWVRIDCRDDGNGIALAHQKHLFDPFFTTKTGQGCTGLGLSICHNIVTVLLGGHISVQSQLAKPDQAGGTTFSLNLPLTAPQGSSERSPSGHG